MNQKNLDAHKKNMNALKLGIQKAAKNAANRYPDQMASVTRCYRLSANLNSWDRTPGKNILFIAGLPASGKSTLAVYISDQLEESGVSCDVFSLDTIGFYKSLRGVAKSQRNDAENYFLSLIEGVSDDVSKMSNVVWDQFYQNAFGKMMKYFEQHSDTLYIIEGVQLIRPQSIPFISHIKTSPVIVVDTPVKECFARRLKHNPDEVMTKEELVQFYQKHLVMLRSFESKIANGFSYKSYSNSLLPMGAAMESSITMEGLLDFIFKKKQEQSSPDILATWHDKIFQSESKNLVGGAPQSMPLRMMTLKRITIDKKTQTIIIQHMNLNLLLLRMRDFYGEKKLDLIFDRYYKQKSIQRFKQKKIARSKMTVSAIHTPIFFALELVTIFRDLGFAYTDRSYFEISRAIYRNTWLRDTDKLDLSNISLDIDPLNEFNSGFTLKEHQLEFIQQYPKLKARLNLNGYILAFDQGLGKTITAIALAECLHATQIFIVCPNSLKEVWRNEIGKYLKRYSDPKVFSEDVVVCESSASSPKNYPKFVITNQEAISNAFPYINPASKASMLIVDEVHNFRNIDGKRTKELLDLKKRINATDVLPMSGTPIKAAPSELTPSIMLIDPLFTEEAAAIYNACFKLNDTAAMNMVQERFGQIIYRKTKKILSLPEKHISTVKWKIAKPEKYYMSNVRGEVMRIFQIEFKKKLDASKAMKQELDQFVRTYSTASAQDNKTYLNYLVDLEKLSGESLGMHELDKGFMDTFLATYVIPKLRAPADIERVKYLETNFIRMKQSALGIAVGQVYPPYRAELFTKLIDENIDRLVEMIQSRPAKTVIFSQIRPVVLHLKEILEANGVGTIAIVGGMGSLAQRMEQINSFKDDDMNMVLAATSQTLGTGVTLVEATQMFFFGPPWRSADFDQCCDRIHRIGQTHDVDIYNVILDTDVYNLSDRMEKIMQWSNRMFSSSMDIEETSGELASESFLLPADLMRFYNQF